MFIEMHHNSLDSTTNYVLWFIQRCAFSVPAQPPYVQPNPDNLQHLVPVLVVQGAHVLPSIQPVAPHSLPVLPGELTKTTLGLLASPANLSAYFVFTNVYRHHISLLQYL